jgi:hypothetical protein
MTKRSAAKPRHLATSPFRAAPEQVVEEFSVGDRVSHDSFGVGTVIAHEGEAVTVDFGSRTARVVSPFLKLERL